MKHIKKLEKSELQLLFGSTVIAQNRTRLVRKVDSFAIVDNKTKLPRFVV